MPLNCVRRLVPLVPHFTVVQYVCVYRRHCCTTLEVRQTIESLPGPRAYFVLLLCHPPPRARAPPLCRWNETAVDLP